MSRHLLHIVASNILKVFRRLEFEAREEASHVIVHARLEQPIDPLLLILLHMLDLATKNIAQRLRNLRSLSAHIRKTFHIRS
jgi:hypothetical protein